MNPAMNVSGAWLMTSMLVGTIGAGFLVYGKKQARAPQLVAGILIAVDSCFVSSPLWMCVGALGVIGALWFALRAGL